jgi:23S rRNA maturation mini-RNase III
MRSPQLHACTLLTLQAEYCDRLLAGSSSNDSSHATAFQLTATELQVAQWAMADEPQSLRRRFRGKPERITQYRKATALEALVGALA